MNLFIKIFVPAILGIGLLFNSIQVQAVEVMNECSLLETSDLSCFSNVEGVLSVSKKEILAGKESADVIFYFQTNVDSDELMLYQNDVLIGILVDSGNYVQDGDDIQGDGVYSMKFTIDVTSTSARPTENEKVVSNVYNVRYGETIVSNEISIDIITPFTDQELDDMSKVDEAISQLINSDGYKLMDKQQKIDAVIELLKFLEEKEIVNSIILNGNQIEFLYNSGVQGSVVVDTFDENINGPITTTTNFATTEPITTTTTNVITTDGITTVVTTETETDSEQTTATTTITAETDTEQTTVPTTTNTTDTITTESSTVATVTTTGTGTTLPQTGYSKWYQVIAGLAVCMTGIGGAMVIGCGKLKKKKR